MFSTNFLKHMSITKLVFLSYCINKRKKCSILSLCKSRGHWKSTN